MTFAPYAEYTESGIDWLPWVPRHWSVKRMRHLFEINPSKKEVRNRADHAEATFLPMEAIGEDGHVDRSRVCRIGDVLDGYTYMRDGDVVFAKITPCFENGKSALLSGLKSGVAFGTTELTVLRPRREAVLGTYLFRMISSEPFRSLGESEMYGAGGQKRVPDDFARNFDIGIPSLDEQGVITDFLDHETARIDALIEEQQRLIDLLQEKRQAVISHAVTKGLDPDVPMKDSGIEWLGDVPAHWEVRKLSNLTDKVTNGYVGPTRDVLRDEGVRYLQSLHIKNNQIVFDPPYYVDHSWSVEHSKSVLREGDVLVVQTGDIGQVAYIPKEFEGANCHALIILSPIRTGLNGEYLSWLLNSEYGYHSLKSIQTGALHPHLNCGYVKDMFVPCPPVDEQRAIVSALNEAVSNYRELREEVRRAEDLLREHRSALISAAVTGKIDVRGWKPQNAPVESELPRAAEPEAPYG